MKRTLYIRGVRVEKIGGGSDHVSLSIQKMLARKFGADAVSHFYLSERAGAGRMAVLREALRGRFWPLDGKAGAELRKAAAEGFALALIDQSVYGSACDIVRSVDPACACAVVFHNDERRYYLERVWKTGRLHNLLLLPSILRAERSAIRQADLLVALSERDALQIESDYGRKPEFILPAIMEDRMAPEGSREPPPGTEFTMLFAGSSFPPNLEGVRWFIEKVKPHVPGRLIVVGRGFEDHRTELSRPDVEIVGSVPDTAPYYGKAHCVISPIFWGFGIKVKTAEALMHGKTVVGTAEAFEGYDIGLAGGIAAQTEKDFIGELTRLADRVAKASGVAKDAGVARAAGIARVGEGDPAPRPTAARSYYESSLSSEANFRKFSEALDIAMASRENIRKAIDV